MNAQAKGREEGFAAAIASFRPTREQFERFARYHACQYKNKAKQEEYVQGYMENWHEPHAQGCTCEDCERVHDIVTD